MLHSDEVPCVEISQLQAFNMFFQNIVEHRRWAAVLNQPVPVPLFPLVIMELLEGKHFV